MDSIALCQRTVDAASRLIAGVGSDELSRPTPCSDWDVKALLNHMIGGNYAFAEALAGKKIEPPAQMPDLVGGDPGMAYARSAAHMMDAWRSPGALQRTLALPFGDIPAAVGINVILMDQLVHSWDLATALGRAYAMEADLAEVALQTLQQTVRPEYRGPGMPFAHEVPCPADAPVQERLLAFTGRNPRFVRQAQR